MEAASRFPLSWPVGWPRARARHVAKFGTKKAGDFFRRLSVFEAASRLTEELRRLGAQSGTEVLSTNLVLRVDGLPRSDQAEPKDPGAAVYFHLRKQPRVLACDRWTRTADNIAAVAAHIEAIRAVDRYGVGSLDQAFAGYVAIPAHASPWWTVLEFQERPTNWDRVLMRFQELARTHHPDRGGDAAVMAKINAARDAAKLDFSNGQLTDW